MARRAQPTPGPGQGRFDMRWRPDWRNMPAPEGPVDWGLMGTPRAAPEAWLLPPDVSASTNPWLHPPPPPPAQPAQQQAPPRPGYRPRVGELADLADQQQWVCSSCNLLNWPSRRRCRECKARRTGADPREWALQGGRASSPPRRHRRRDGDRERERAASPITPPHARPASRDARRSDPSGSAPPGNKVGALKDALAALRAAAAPDTVLAPLLAELARLEADAQTARPIGQRLDAARAALRKATSRAEAAQSALEGAKEKAARAAEDKAARAAELAALEAELPASANQAGQTEDLAAAVGAALRAPNAAYSLAALQAAYARYEDAKAASPERPSPPRAKKGKDKDASPPKAPPDAEQDRPPGTKRSPAGTGSPGRASGLQQAAVLALTDAEAMEEDGQGAPGPMDPPEAAKKARPCGGLGAAGA